MNKPARYGELIEKVRLNLNDDTRFADTLQFVRDRVQHYSEALGFEQVDILEALESHRNYWSANFYQESNLPKLDETVTVYETYDNMIEDVKPSLGFYCSVCGGVSKDPNSCNSGREMSKGKICNWATYGLFRTHESFRCIVKESFLEKPIVYDIFMPMSKRPVNEAPEVAGEIEQIKELCTMEASLVNTAFNLSEGLGIAALTNSTQSFESFLRGRDKKFIRGMSIEYRTFIVELLKLINEPYRGVATAKLLMN